MVNKAFIDYALDAIQPNLHTLTVAIVVHKNWVFGQWEWGGYEGGRATGGAYAGHVVEDYRTSPRLIQIAAFPDLSDRLCSPSEVYVFGGKDSGRDFAVLLFDSSASAIIGSQKVPVAVSKLEFDPSDFGGAGALVYGYPDELTRQFRPDAHEFRVVTEFFLPASCGWSWWRPGPVKPVRQSRNRLGHSFGVYSPAAKRDCFIGNIRPPVHGL